MPNASLAMRSTRNAAFTAGNNGDSRERTTGDTKPAESVLSPLLLTRIQVASLINVRPRTFDRLVAANQFPTADIVMNAKLIRWRRSTVETWIDAGGKL